MSLLARITEEQFKALAEPLRAEYEKDLESELYILDVTATDGWELANVVNLKSALSSEREKVKKLNKTVKRFDGLEPEKAREALAKYNELSTMNVDQKVEEKFKVVQNQLVEKHNKELHSISEKYTKLKSQLQQELITSSAIKALRDPKVDGDVDLMLPHVISQVRMTEKEDGTFVVEVVDKNGNPKIGDTNGNPMSIDQLVLEMKGNKIFARGFNSSGASGGGARGANSSGVMTGNVKSVSASDKAGMSAHLEDIAAGKVLVDMNK